VITLRLVWAMLRYRTASLLVLFFLLAPALHGRLQSARWQFLAGVLVLFACYVVATCLNDVFDYEVDRVNHPGARERPLVTGAASRRQLLTMAAALAALSIVLAALTGPLALGAVVVSLCINVLYSAPPARLCSRPLAAAPVLAFAYVAVPYAIGLGSAGATPGAADVRVVAALMVLFAGRMLLKDFRDRRGDAMFGKRTFLLVHGKRATVAAVLVCVLAGDALLVSVLPSLVLIAAVQSYFAVIAFELFRLARSGPEAELAAIARGARMGNAVILTWLGYSLLPASAGNVFAVALAALYWLVYLLPASAAAATTAATREPTATEAARAS
jgi:4-hydroxybenzoate polyprenyltransferase